mgnify:FL=1
MNELNFDIGDTIRVVSTGAYLETDELYVGKEFTVDGRDEDGMLFSTNLLEGTKWYIVPEERHMYERVSEEEDANI